MTLLLKPTTTAPFAVDFGQSVNDPGGAFLIELGVIEGVKRTPGAWIDEVVDAFPDIQLAAFFEDFFREACVLDGSNRLGH